MNSNRNFDVKKILKGLIGENKKSSFFLLLTHFPALYCIFLRKNCFFDLYG